MGRKAGALLWNRMRITLPSGATDVDTELTQVSHAFEPVDPPLEARIQVVPLVPIGAWNDITHGDPYFDSATGTIHVAFSNSNKSPAMINVMFWDPHTLAGAGAAASYVDPPPAPIVNAYVPPSGVDGEVIGVQGQYFTGATIVTVNGLPAVFVVIDDFNINVTLPAGFTTGPICVTTPTGTGCGPNFIRTAWFTLASLNTPRVAFAYGTLPDGRIVVAGGLDSVGTYLASTEIYDPVLNTWTTVAPMTAPRGQEPGYAVLADGRFLVAGGQTTGDVAVDTGEVYDPILDTWTPTGLLSKVRTGGNCLRITTGPNTNNVIIAFGSTGTGTGYDDSEIYDVGSNTWGSIAVNFGATIFGEQPIVTLVGGDILAVGGSLGNVNPPVSCQIWDSATNTWAVTGSLPGAPVVFEQRLVRLLSGPLTGFVMAAGGTSGSGPFTSESRVTYYDPGLGTWSIGASLIDPRSRGVLSYLTDGRLMIAGGLQQAGPTILAEAEFYDHTLGTWSAAPPMNQVKYNAGFGPIAVGGGKLVVFAGIGPGFARSAHTEMYVGPP